MAGCRARIPHRRSFKLLLGLAICVVVVWPALVSQVTSAQEPSKQEPPLPLKRVVLFSSSVGFFEHRGEVEGDRQIEFSFKSSNLVTL
jgi:hypothetical protein